VANSSKIEKFFGSDAPRGYLEKAKAESKPWYLKADYPPQDIVLAPDGSVRAGTLPALVEHLTDHEYRGACSIDRLAFVSDRAEDTNYISTFLLTFKSFSTVDEIFDLLVARFKTPPATGLTDVQLQEWKTQKQEPFQIRCVAPFF
jgi:son of sevenless